MDHVYRPLNAERGEIRVLHLLPSESFDDILQCTLSYTYLSDPLEYEGLSYVWGKPEFTKAIKLEGNDFRITPNLESALRHLRKPHAKRTIWVDAICINQKDVSERNHQITLMKQIYQRCTTDLAWLLCDTDNVPESAPLKDLNSEMHSGVELFKKLCAKDGTTLDLLRPQSSTGSRAARANNKQRYILCSTQRRSLQCVFSRPPLWSRIWVMQELACAPRIVLVAGHETLDWGLLDTFLGDTAYTDAFHMPMGHDGYHKVIGTIFYAVKTVQNQRRITKEGKSSSLLDVLGRFKKARATDDRDKIYGLLGLVSEESASTIEVDYRKSTAEVFAEAALAIMNADGNLDLICQNPFKGAKENAENDEVVVLPSWTPDFARHAYEDYENQFSTLLYGQRGIYNAGKPRCTVPGEVLQGQRLKTRGCQLGRVGRLDGQWKGDTWRSVLDVGWYQEWMRQYLDRTEELSSYGPTGESGFRAFWRTLVMDCSAYPIQRLTGQQISADEAVFRDILALDLETESMDERRKLLGSLVSNRMASRLMMHWRFAISDGGLFLMITETVQEGDVITVLDGARVPVILRPVQGSVANVYVVKGSAYVHGFMDGEVRGCLADGELEEEEFMVE